MLKYYRYSPFYFCPQDKACTSEVTKGKQAEVAKLEGSDFPKGKEAEVTNWQDSPFPKVQQAEVTNGHKLLFCKVNKMSHCCVEVLQVFTLLFLSTGKVFFDVSVPPPPIYSGSHLQQAAPQGSAHGKYFFICNEVSRIRNSMFALPIVRWTSAWCFHLNWQEEEECYNLNKPTYKPEEDAKKQRGQDPRQITMTRREYIEEVLSQIEDAQSTPIGDEFQQYLSQWVVFITNYPQYFLYNNYYIVLLS